MVIADETDEAAMAKWKHYKAGADVEALAWMFDQAGADTNAPEHSTAKVDDAAGVGDQLQHGHAGRLLRQRSRACWTRCAAVPGTKGIMLTFDDFLIGMEQFGQRIQPLMQSRARVRAVA